MFEEMAVLVDAQGEMLDAIEVLRVAVCRSPPLVTNMLARSMSTTQRATRPKQSRTAAALARQFCIGCMQISCSTAIGADQNKKGTDAGVSAVVSTIGMASSGERLSEPSCQGRKWMCCLSIVILIAGTLSKPVDYHPRMFGKAGKAS